MNLNSMSVEVSSTHAEKGDPYTLSRIQGTIEVAINNMK